MSNVLVHVLHHDEQFHESSLGVLREAARCAQALGGEAHALVIGEAPDAGALGGFGAARVYRAPAPLGLAAPVVGLMARLVRERGFAYAFLAGGPLGLEAGAGLAARLGAGVAVEVTGIAVESGRLVPERLVIADTQISEIELASEVGVIVARSRAFEPGTGSPARAPVEEIVAEPADPRTRMLVHAERGDAQPSGIEEAEVVVAGGRGLGRPEGFALCAELAAALGPRSAVAATRAVVDAGWYPYDAQVGQTGRRVAPKLYVAAGISGAVQHRVGMQDSESILAINKDPQAPIFDVADLGVVGDLNRVLPRLSAALRARHAGTAR